MSKHAHGILVVLILIAMLVALGIQLFAVDVFSAAGECPESVAVNISPSDQDRTLGSCRV